MNGSTIAKLIGLVLALPLCAVSQYKKRTVSRYSFKDERFHHDLELFSDSTFLYKSGFKLGNVACIGKWKITNDTLKLLGQKSPWKIVNVDESRIDTIKGLIVIKVVTSEPDSQAVKDFGVRVNNKCGLNAYTNDFGIAEFREAKAEKIYLDYYEEYATQGQANNYFLVTMDSYPIYNSPRNVTWKDWIIENGSICPMECGKKLDHIKLSNTTH